MLLFMVFTLISLHWYKMHIIVNNIYVHIIKEGVMMGLNTKNAEVSILRVFINSRTVNVSGESHGYSVDIRCNEVFINEETKKEAEKICSWSLNYAPELMIYKFIKEKEPIIEFNASQYADGVYNINITNVFDKYLPFKKEYKESIERIKEEVVGRIIYLFKAYSL